MKLLGAIICWAKGHKRGKLAEFNDDEIHEILRQAGFRSLIPTEQARQ